MHEVSHLTLFSTFLKFSQLSSNFHNFSHCSLGYILLMHQFEVGRDGDVGHGVDGDAVVGEVNDD